MGNKGALEILVFAFSNKRVNVPFKLIVSPLFTGESRRHLITSKNMSLASDASYTWRKRGVITSLN